MPGGARCVVNGLARPRRYDLLSQDRKAINAGPPTIVRGLSSAVMTWTDNRDGQKRAYAVPLDDALRNRKLPIDITPEGAKVYTPTLLPFAQRFLAVYWDAQGAAAGVYTRWLDNNAVIAGPPLLATTTSTPPSPSRSPKAAPRLLPSAGGSVPPRGSTSVKRRPAPRNSRFGSA